MHCARTCYNAIMCDCPSARVGLPCWRSDRAVAGYPDDKRHFTAGEMIEMRQPGLIDAIAKDPAEIMFAGVRYTRSDVIFSVCDGRSGLPVSVAGFYSRRAAEEQIERWRERDACEPL